MLTMSCPAAAERRVQEELPGELAEPKAVQRTSRLSMHDGARLGGRFLATSRR